MMNTHRNMISETFFEVEGTWYGGVHITGKTGVPISLDREEYMELDTEPEPETYAGGITKRYTAGGYCPAF